MYGGDEVLVDYGDEFWERHAEQAEFLASSSSARSVQVPFSTSLNTTTITDAVLGPTGSLGPTQVSGLGTER